MFKASLGSMDAPDEQFLLHETGKTDSDTKPEVSDDDDMLDDDGLNSALGDASVIQEIVDRTLERGENNTAEMEIDDLFVHLRLLIHLVGLTRSTLLRSGVLILRKQRKRLN